MQNGIINQNTLLRFIMKTRMATNISVSGVSMEPTLFEGDVIHIVSGEYKIGDILIFVYKHNDCSHIDTLE